MWKLLERSMKAMITTIAFSKIFPTQDNGGGSAAGL